MVSGFSLLELMMVAAILGILASLALPAYRQYMVRSSRVTTIATMLQVATCQEKIYLAARAYDTSRCLGETGIHYRLEYAQPGETSAPGYLLLAHPLGSQVNDPCGVLRLDHLGERTVGNAAADSARCWSGR
ncbi:MAG: prepilin-type N-terminal cleavage/methylation domain-containing protein [Xanthomonadales bacterium]|nr:prepilin-type N-terminal cleavage/methylation domain-containing protein [Xanthomonadales bacterium]NIX12848.1 prepilin-type N-terminal cleavage/methylation domain-containing protein [Xanthomonadales bacterium]